MLKPCNPHQFVSRWCEAFRLTTALGLGLLRRTIILRVDREEGVVILDGRGSYICQVELLSVVPAL